MTDGLQLTTYFGERDRVGGHLLADALLDVYGADRIRASLLLRGAAGFGAIHDLHTDRILSLSVDLPVVSVAIDLPERIQSTLARVLAIKHRGLVTLERTRLVSPDLPVDADPPDRAVSPVDVDPPDRAGPADRAGPPDRAGPADGAGPPVDVDPPDRAGRPDGAETKLTIVLGRGDRVDGSPAFVAICDLLHQQAIAGASVLLGVDGTRAGRRTRASFFGGNPAVPMIVVAVGSTAAITAVLPRLGLLVPDVLLTLERVRVCKRDGVRLATPHQLPDIDDAGRAVWQKLTLYTSESATHNGRTLHLELIRRLRDSRAAGATSLRGIWGFHGDHAPHGDRLLQLRRRVPVVTTLIDRPSRIAASFAIVDDLTRETGLVTSEIVPAVLALATAGPLGSLQLADPPRPTAH